MRIFLSFLLVLIFPLQAWASFSDMGVFYPHREAVEFLQQQGVVEGYKDGTFRPQQKINRAEFLKIVVEAVADVDESATTNCFYDVEAGSWYTKYVCYAKQQGIVEGYKDGTFRPGQEINFVEALKIVLKAFEIDYQEETDPWYRGSVELAADRKFIPKDVSGFGVNISRGQMADIIWRILKFQNSEKLEDSPSYQQLEGKFFDGDFREIKLEIGSEEEIQPGIFMKLEEVNSWRPKDFFLRVRWI